MTILRCLGAALFCTLAVAGALAQTQPPSPSTAPAAEKLGVDAAGFLYRITQIVPPNPQQKAQLQPILAEYDAKLADFRAQRKSQIDAGKRPLFSAGWMAIDDLTYVRLEDETWDRVEAEVLTPAQLAIVQAYRIYYRAAVPLNAVEVNREQGDRIKKKADDLVKTMPGISPEAYQARLKALQEWSRTTVLTPQQQAKLADLEAKRDAAIAAVSAN